MSQHSVKSRSRKNGGAGSGATSSSIIALVKLPTELTEAAASIEARLEKYVRESALNYGASESVGPLSFDEKALKFIYNYLNAQRTIFHGCSVALQTLLDFVHELELDAVGSLSQQALEAVNSQPVLLHADIIERSRLVDASTDPVVKTLMENDQAHHYLDQYPLAMQRIPMVSFLFGGDRLALAIPPFATQAYELRNGTKSVTNTRHHTALQKQLAQLRAQQQHYEQLKIDYMALCQRVGLEPELPQPEPEPKPAKAKRTMNVKREADVEMAQVSEVEEEQEEEARHLTQKTKRRCTLCSITTSGKNFKRSDEKPCKAAIDDRHAWEVV